MINICKKRCPDITFDHLKTLLSDQRKELLLMHDASAAIIGQTTSAADGSYAFETGYADGHTVLLLEDTGRVQAIGGGVLPL